MKPALQALLVAPEPEMRTNIELGSKQVTILEGHRDYHIGPVLLCCHIEPWCVQADIMDVQHTSLAEVSEKALIDAEFGSREEAVEALRRFYPNIVMHSPVTVIRWANVRGALTGQA